MAVFSTYDPKAAPTAADIVLIADKADGDNLKTVEIGSIHSAGTALKTLVDYDGSLVDAVAGIGATETTLIVNIEPDALTADLTIPSTLHLKWASNCVLDTDLSIRNATYKWTASGSGTSEYYLELAGGGDPGISEPSTLAEDDTVLTIGAAGSLAAGEWDWADNDTLGYNTVYIRLSDSADPDSKAADFVEAGYILTINGDFEAGYYQVFSGNGSISFGNGIIVIAEWFGLVDDGATDNSTAITKAIESQPLTGGAIQFAGTATGYCIADLGIRPLINLRGVAGQVSRTTSALIGNGYSPKATKFVVKSGDSGFIVLAGNGFNRFEDFFIEGEAGAKIGLDIRAADVHTSNVSIYGFLDGIGAKMTFNIRSKHDNLNIQGCGLGLYLATSNHASVFNNLTIENSTCGIYGDSNQQAVVFNSLTAESLRKGLLGTSFPDVSLITVKAQLLTDLGLGSQADFEGGVVMTGSTVTFNGLYLEAISRIMLYAGLSTSFTINGAYFNDQAGSYPNPPRNIINGKYSNGIVLLGSVISTSNTRGNALFDIISSRGNVFYGNTIYHTDGTIYTGDEFEDTSTGTINYCYRSLLKPVSGNPLGLRFDNLALTKQTVSSSSNIIDINCVLGAYAQVRYLAENTTISSHGEQNGQYLEVHVVQDGTGSYTVGWGAEFNSPVWSDAGNTAFKSSSIAFRWDSEDAKWYQISGQATYH